MKGFLFLVLVAVSFFSIFSLVEAEEFPPMPPVPGFPVPRNPVLYVWQKGERSFIGLFPEEIATTLEFEVSFYFPRGGFQPQDAFSISFSSFLQNEKTGETLKDIRVDIPRRTGRDNDLDGIYTYYWVKIDSSQPLPREPLLLEVLLGKFIGTVEIYFHRLVVNDKELDKSCWQNGAIKVNDVFWAVFDVTTATSPRDPIFNCPVRQAGDSVSVFAYWGEGRQREIKETFLLTVQGQLVPISEDRLPLICDGVEIVAGYTTPNFIPYVSKTVKNSLRWVSETAYEAIFVFFEIRDEKGNAPRFEGESLVKFVRIQTVISPPVGPVSGPVDDDDDRTKPLRIYISGSTLSTGTLRVGGSITLIGKGGKPPYIWTCGEAYSGNIGVYPWKTYPKKTIEVRGKQTRKEFCTIELTDESWQKLPLPVYMDVTLEDKQGEEVKIQIQLLSRDQNSFLLNLAPVKPKPISPNGKLTTIWGSIKE